jgi:hypothetical protein
MSSAFVAVAKFQVISVLREGYRREDKPYTAAIVVKMSPVYAPAGDETNENWKFTKASPTGLFEMRIENEQLFDSFFVGQQIYLPMIDADRVALLTVSEALASLKEKTLV